MVLQFQTAPQDCRSKAVKLCFTQSAQTHYPIEPLHNSLSYKLFFCEGNWSFQCAKDQEEDKHRQQPLLMFSNFSRPWDGAEPNSLRAAVKIIWTQQHFHIGHPPLSFKYSQKKRFTRGVWFGIIYI